MIGRRRSGRLWQGLLLLWLPTLILLGALNLRRQLPGLPQGTNRQAVLQAGDFAVNRYTDAQGQEYLDFTISIQGKTRTLIDRVYDYRVQEGKIYARGVTGAAAADPSAGACRLYVSKQYPRYRQAWPGVTAPKLPAVPTELDQSQQRPLQRAHPARVQRGRGGGRTREGR